MLSPARPVALLCVISLFAIPPFAAKPAWSGALTDNSSENVIRSIAQAPGRAPRSEPRTTDSYDVLLHSRSLADQHEALTAILDNPQKYIPRIQQSIRDYPRLLRTDPTAANRAVYISALVRDPSFPRIMVRSLGAANVLDECQYPCPVVFALTIQVTFTGWNLPTSLDSQLTTVKDLRAEIQNVSRISLKVGAIEDVVHGPGLERQRNEIEGKTEEELIQMAGPMTQSTETRMFAAFRLETLIADSKNRIDLYLLALNDFEDASGEYRGAVHESIYRAELARARGQ